MLFLTSAARVPTDADCSLAEPCEKTYCAYGANCVQTPDGHAECQCPTECPSMFTPVCGTDGVTYTNHCMMRMKSCRQEKNTRVHHTGECGEYRNFSVDVAGSVSGIVHTRATPRSFYLRLIDFCGMICVSLTVMCLGCFVTTREK